MIELQAGSAQAVISRFHGGRLAQLTVDGRELLVPQNPDRGPMAWGSYPMAPYAGRIRQGRFPFEGEDVVVPITMGIHAIHGTVYHQPWEQVGPAEVRCELGPDWPFGGFATHRYDLTPESLVCTLSVHAEDRAMPAQVGWHPWFVKPDHLEFRPTLMYRRDPDGIPDGTLVDVPDGPWDDCFTGVTQPIVLGWNGFRLEITSDCDTWVVYDEPSHATCVEPQSGPPDAFNSTPVVLEPHDTLTRTMTWRWA